MSSTIFMSFLLAMPLPWTILVTLLLGFIGYLLKTVHDLKRDCARNERILKSLMDRTVLEESDEESEIPADFRLPDYSDSESDYDSKSIGTWSSGYDSENLIDTSVSSPSGPVSFDQTYLSSFCVHTSQFMKAVVDDLHSIIHIVSWTENGMDSEWTPTTCHTCTALIKDALVNYRIPFAMDLEATQADMENADEVRRLLDEYEGVSEDMIEDEDDDDDVFFEKLFKTTVFDSTDDEDEDFGLEDFEFNFSDLESADGNDETAVDSDNEDVIEKLIATLLDEFEVDQDEMEYDYSIFDEASQLYPGF